MAGQMRDLVVRWHHLGRCLRVVVALLLALVAVGQDLDILAELLLYTLGFSVADMPFNSAAVAQRRSFSR